MTMMIRKFLLLSISAVHPLRKMLLRLLRDWMVLLLSMILPRRRFINLPLKQVVLSFLMQRNGFNISLVLDILGNAHCSLPMLSSKAENSRRILFAVYSTLDTVNKSKSIILKIQNRALSLSSLIAEENSFQQSKQVVLTNLPSKSLSSKIVLPKAK